MNKEAHKGADDTSRCSKTHLRRSRSNIICVAAKRYVPLCIHARVIESMRNHESALQSSIHAKTAACCATYDMLHMHMWLRGHTSMQ